MTQLPFTTAEFLGVFQAYNLAVWPVQVVLVLIALVIVFLAVERPSNSDRAVSLMLACLWFWMGTVYHLGFFASINRAAYVFGAAFILQAMLFVVAGVFRSDLSFQVGRNRYSWVGAVLLAYALMLYPLLGSAWGHTYPTAPTFGLPCPTTIFTFGILLFARSRVSGYLLVIPLIWSVIGLSAVINFGVLEDTGLLIAAVLATVLIIVRNRALARVSSA